jgi:hypothetical protein
MPIALVEQLLVSSLSLIAWVVSEHAKTKYSGQTGVVVGSLSRALFVLSWPACSRGSVRGLTQSAPA